VKYMVMMFGSAAEMVEVQSKEWIAEMISFMVAIDQELAATGELVDAQGLADGSTARTVSLQDGAVVVSDGPYAEAKESLVGYWILDVESDERLFEICARIVHYSRQVEVRRIMDGPPEV
jgi:hypothetical protein